MPEEQNVRQGAEEKKDDERLLEMRKHDPILAKKKSEFEPNGSSLY